VLFLLAAAARHRQLDSDRDKNEPAPLTRDDSAAWAKWSPPGWTKWNHLVLDIRHSSWVARKIVLPLERAQRLPFLRPAFRAKLTTQPIYDDPKREGGIPRPADANPTGKTDDEGQVVLWEVYDRENRAHHYLNEKIEEYGEKSEDYPYPDPQTGEPAVPGYFPCSPCVASHPATTNGDRAFGSPLLAGGWGHLIAGIKLHSKIVDGAMAARYLSTVKELLEKPATLLV